MISNSDSFSDRLNKLLDHSDAFRDLECFAEPFNKLKAARPDLFPKKGVLDAVLAMAAYKRDSEDELQIGFLNAKGVIG